MYRVTCRTTQACFPDRSAWETIARVLRWRVDDGALETFSGKTSLSFPAGEHRRVTVRVVDPRGNEALRVRRLPGAAGAKWGAR